MASTLRERGWHISDEGFEQCKQNGKTDIESLRKVALDTDLREIGKAWLPEDITRGRADYVEGPGIVQLQKIRNVSAPKDNEDSQAAPRLMKLSLTDGHATCQAVETEVLKDIGVNTPPGSKIKLKSTIDIEHGFLLLNNKNTQFLGGRVEKLVEGWELKKKLAQQARVNVGTDGGGPPLFVPFGQKLDNSQIRNPRRDNFKSLEASKTEKSEKEKKEDDEFEAARRATIAQALQAKEEAQQKKFGAGHKQVASDHEIAKITEMGFRADEAATALRLHNGNVQHAIDYLLTGKRPGPTGPPHRQGSYEGGGDRGRGRRGDRRDEDGGGVGRGRRGRGGDTEEGVDSRPSGPATLFDFLETKFPASDNKGSSKEDKSSYSKPSVSEKPSTEKPAPQPQDTRERPRSANQTNTDLNRPKPTQTLPPRFNKSKPDSGQTYPSQEGQGRYHNDRAERSRDDRPRTANSDRNYDNRNYNDRNYNDKNYNDRNYNDRNYNDRNYNNRGYNDRNYNDRNYDRDRNRGYNDRRTNDYGDTRGNRDNRGPGGQNYNKNNNSDYSQRNTNNSASVKSNFSDRSASKENKENQEQQSKETNTSKTTDTSNSQYKTQSAANTGNTKSRDVQKGQNEKQEQTSNTPPVSGNRRDNYSKGGSNSQQVPQNNYRSARQQTGGYVANGNYGNQQHVGYGGGPPHSTAAQFQPQSDYMYAEPQMLAFGLKKGDKVMAKYWEDGAFYEAVVEYYAPQMRTCMVVFLEYGNCEEVLLSDVKPCLPHMPMGPQPGGLVMQHDMSVPPPGVFFSAPPPGVPAPGMDDPRGAINTMEFRRGGGGAAYNRKEGRPAQQLYQPPSQRR